MPFKNYSHISQEPMSQTVSGLSVVYEDATFCKVDLDW